jgi:hypothetical protein
MNMNQHNLITGKNSTMKTMKNSLILVALAALGAGCVEPAKDINRVGPNFVKKAMFDQGSEWYARGTTVDKQAHTPFPVIGYADDLERVKWQVLEDRLLAIRSYDRAPGSDPANAGDNQVVAAFRITKHFDVRRQYNPVNGVETNVIEENDYDRPWYQREYMRVDWSRNIADSWSMQNYLTMYAPKAVSHNADNDPTYPWRTRIECSNPDDASTCDYLETTMDVIMEPDPYACSFLDGISPCNGASAKFKLSFLKIDPKNDYVPLDYPDYLPIKFGTLVDPSDDRAILTSDGQGARICTDDEVGIDGMGQFSVTRSGGPGSAWRACNPNTDIVAEDCVTIEAQCAELQELWVADSPSGYELCDIAIHDPDDCFPFTMPVFSKFAFFRTDRYYVDREDGTTLTGRERLINRYNIWEKSRNDDGTIIPMADRTPKPIIFYTNVQFPADLLDAARALGEDWDEAFRATVASAKGIPLADVPTMFEVRENDCNVANVEAFVNEHDELELDQRLKDHGIAEVQEGNLEASCAVVEHYSKMAGGDHPTFKWQQTGDVRYSFLNWTKKLELAGPLGVAQWAADPVTGQTISGSANVFGDDLDVYSNWGADVVDLINGRITQDDVVNGTQVRKHIEAVRARWSKKITKETVDKFLNVVDRRLEGVPDETYFKQVPLTSINYNLDLLADTGFEEENLVTADMVRLFGGPEGVEALKNGGPIPQNVLDRARPSSWARTTLPPAVLNNKAFDDAARQAPLVDMSNMKAAERFKERQEFFDRQSMCFLKEQVEPAVAGLAADLADKDREEVVATIRSAVFRAVMAHEVGHVVGLRHNFEGSSDALNFFPDYWDVDTGDDRMAATDRKSEVAYSSIMDYHQRFNSDFAGIGLYDRAAVKFGYGEMVEVFDESDEAFVPRGWFDISYLFAPSDLPYLLGDEGNEDKIDALYDEVYDQVLQGDNTVILDVKSASGIVENADNLYKRKDVPFAKYKRTEVLRTFGQVDDDRQPNPYAVPYSYCSDSYAWGGNLTCNRYDMGVTSEEIVKNAGEMYEFYYPFNAFRGHRVEGNYYGWTPNSYLTRLNERTYAPMLNAFRYFYYYRRSTANIWPGIRDWSTASLMGMNFFARVLQTPEVGAYCHNVATDTYIPRDEASAADCDSGEFEIGIEDGRFYRTHYTDELDFHVSNVGHFYDKAIAIQAMTDTNAFFFRDFSNLVNRGSFSIGYYRVFQDEMLGLFGGLIRGDRSVYSANVSVSGGEANIDYAPFVNLDGTAAPAATGTKIRPADSFNLKQWAMFYGMANLSSTVDQTMDFSKRVRITLAGSRSDPTIDGTVVADIAEFTDPDSGLVYRAAQTDQTNNSIGWQMLNDANTFVTNVYEPKKAALAAATDPAAIDAAEVELEIARIELNDKVQLIDWMRYLGDILEYAGG